MAETGELLPAEAVQLGATDGVFFGRFFFPNTCRQNPPPFDRRVWNLLDNPSARFVALQMFRGSAKTTRARVFTAKRIAYGLSRTIVYVGKSQEHAARSVEWVLKQITHNKLFALTFGLAEGSKWTGHEVEILNTVLGIRTRVLALGVGGSVRGVNIDDYRPDLIIGDDLTDEENSATPDGREKMDALWFGALKESLAPASECPDAKMVLLGTAMVKDDLVDKCSRDAEWLTLTVSNLDERSQSTWPDRWPTEVVLAEKQAAINRNQLSLWLRERECRLVSPETSAFKPEWIQYYDALPAGCIYYMGVDPTPPAKDAASYSRKVDDAAIVVIAAKGPAVYLVGYYLTKSPDPEEFINQIFTMYLQWRPMIVGFESVLFARVMKAYIEKEMLKRRLFFPLKSVEDRRAKITRIIQAVTGRAAARQVHCLRAHTEFLEQFTFFPDVKHDDLLDAFAIAMDCINPGLEGADALDETDYPALTVAGACP